MYQTYLLGNCGSLIKKMPTTLYWLKHSHALFVTWRDFLSSWIKLLDLSAPSPLSIPLTLSMNDSRMILYSHWWMLKKDDYDWNCLKENFQEANDCQNKSDAKGITKCHYFRDKRAKEGIDLMPRCCTPSISCNHAKCSALLFAEMIVYLSCMRSLKTLCWTRYVKMPFVKNLKSKKTETQ